MSFHAKKGNRRFNDAGEIVCKKQSKPFLSFLTGDHIQALSIPAAAVDDETLSFLSAMKTLRYVVVLGDSRQFNAISRLRIHLSGSEIFDDEEIIDEELARMPQPGEALLVK